MYELGKCLARLHVLTQNYRIRDKDNYKLIYAMFLKNKEKIKKRLPERKMFEYIKENIKNVEAPRKARRSVCHGDFRTENMRFRGNEIVNVIDWDLIGRTSDFYDLGVSMQNCFDRNLKFNFSKLSELVRGYDQIRKLTAVEREHLFEALQWGLLSYTIFNLSSGVRVNKNNLHRVKVLMELDKENFYQKLLF